VTPSNRQLVVAIGGDTSTPRDNVTRVGGVVEYF
jgi:hypothetical protein